ncbi:nitroimidazol reductase NimA-like FMN-containing flavoprotein (pyridoxamine 5'-phosphate oxidase superfamily) [Kitasatospora gansuensis]|uniref:Nitroimidazol reductase NimA-like FMN-containing flavoprotein (Pyridoxamine 5'-phosphate oxidase superfamily) n=1 Tax=Kitasatospora gansuensis TaxID=258050 RepID=A0A7W7S874_9ACTN|nr:pyridoxamine 5'-phosphate oxidase family protein [Kitasatospora gansuensis]MBB4945625.1 nitroimidazol reductase NimA-like FMN-containing flavoprotein (pyridoxamine 5'-phosphate oxidase superfamily) [Kitasatospora gansuensis]
MDRDDRVETLSEAECLHLLRTVPIGRVVYTEHALPAVLPVAFEVAPDDRLILGLRAGSSLSRALDGTVAAFQADLLDPVSRSGWSVLVHGRAEVVRDEAEYRRLLRSGPQPWIGGGQQRMFVRITPELVSGRRLLTAGQTLHRA